MEDLTGEQGIRERLELMEAMVLEGRRETERWGWAFVLWGVAYYVAIVWSVTTAFAWAWPVTMIVATLIMAGIVRMRGTSGLRTTVSRSVSSIWVAFGISVFLLLMALGFSGRMTDAHVAFAILAAMLGMVNGASAMILRWRVQMACAVVWWAAAVVCCVNAPMALETPMAFLAALFLCQIVFGAYCMMLDARIRGQRGVSHA